MFPINVFPSATVASVVKVGVDRTSKAVADRSSIELQLLQLEFPLSRNCCKTLSQISDNCRLNDNNYVGTRP